MINILIAALIVASGSLTAQSLEEYCRIAAENNPALKASFNDYQAALQRIAQVSSLPDPTFSFGYFISPIETRVGPQRVKLSLSQMFPWFGTLQAQGDVAASQAESKYHAFLDARNKLCFDVASIYYKIFELTEWQSIEQKNISILTSYKSIANSNFATGKGPMVDVLRVDMMVRDAQTDLSILIQRSKPLSVEFNRLLNRPLQDSVVVTSNVTVVSTKNFPPADSVVPNNPRLAEIEAKIKAGRASEESAVRQGYPKFGVGLDYVSVSPRTDMDLVGNGRDAIMPMITMSIPIYRDKYNAAEKEAQLQQNMFSMQKADLNNALLSNYEMARFEAEQQSELVELYKQQTVESEKSLNLLLSAYSNSKRDFEEVLRMEQQLLRYEKLKVSALAQHRIAIAKMEYLTAKQR